MFILLGRLYVRSIRTMLFSGGVNMSLHRTMSAFKLFQCISHNRKVHNISNTIPNWLAWNTFHQDISAADRTLQRYNLSQLNHALFTRVLHTSILDYSRHGGYRENQPPTPFDKNGDGKSDGKSDGNNNDKDNGKNDWSMLIRKVAMWMVFTYMIMTAISWFRIRNSTPESSRFVSWNEFVHHMLSHGEVEEIIVRPDVNFATIILREGAIIKNRKSDQRILYMNIVDLKQFEEKLREVESSLGIPVNSRIPVIYERNMGTTVRLIASLIFTAVIASVLWKNKSLRGPLDGIFSQMTRAKYTMIDPMMPGSGRGVKFSDVAGAKEAKVEVMEFVDFLKNPEKYRSLGAKVPKGALLLGPPGCGKTMLAKAIATEGEVPFLAMNGSEFIEMIGGLGAARVRDLFKEGKKRAPCIIYIDEIDAIGRKRPSGNLMEGSSGESEQTLNQLLVELDGIGTKEGVVLLASTNRLDILDKALLRPGRFDRHIMMDLPTLEERREIFEHHMKSIVLEHSPEHYSRRLASLTLGFSGADIANVANEAALKAARDGMKVVTAANLEYAVERVVGGTEKRSQVLSSEERQVLAYHESGHALLGWLMEHTDGLLKVTIVPRTNQALGFAQYAPKDQKLYTQEELSERMCMALGGRVAESLIFNHITTGAQDDLQKVTKMAYAQVLSFGFSEAVGHVSFTEEEIDPQMGKRPFSKRAAAIIDEEASRIIFEAYKKAESVLKLNLEKLHLLAKALLEKETLNYDDVVAVLGPPSVQKIFIEPLQFESEINAWKEAGKQQ